MSLSQPLYALQLIDSKINLSKSRLAEIEIALSQNEAVQKAKKKFDVAENKLSAGKKELKSAEIEVEKQTFKIEQNTKKTYSGSVTDPKVLSDLQQEATSLAKHLETLEEIQLDKMMAYDDLDEQFQKTDTDLNQAKDNAAQQNSMLMAERTSLTAEVKSLLQSRATSIPKIDEELLNKYSALALKKGGVAVTHLKQDMCGACGVKLTASLFQEAKSRIKITRCSTCKRILHAG